MGFWSRFACFLFTIAALAWSTGCGGYSGRTEKVRSALDHGKHDEALGLLNQELEVKADGELPEKLHSDNALLVLERGAVKQSLARFDESKKDYQAADKALDVLDLSHNASDEVGRWLLSDSAGRYKSPPHEKILLNVLNMLNYLETNDLSGARVEARRMVVMSRFLSDKSRDKHMSLGLGSMLAGFAFEKSGDTEEAKRFYADGDRIASLSCSAPAGLEGDEGEILIVIGDGRVPHRVAKHVPIGEALVRAAPYLAPDDRAQATKLAAQGLVTWVNFPTLAHAAPLPQPPFASVDGQTAPLEVGLDVTKVVHAEWKKIEGEVMAAATARAVTRAIIGKSIEAATESKKNKSLEAAGLIVSLFVQVAMTAADTPDTRSWETLPSRLSVARMRVAPGVHEVKLEARGMKRVQRVTVPKGGWAAVSLLTLR